MLWPLLRFALPVICLPTAHLFADAVVAVPADAKAFSLAVARHGLHVGEALLVNDGVAIRIVEAATNTSATLLPANRVNRNGIKGSDE